MSGKGRIKSIFITSTDTGAGKTVVTGLLARYLSDKGYKVVTQKWVQTGVRGFADSDVATHLHFLKKSKAVSAKLADCILPYCYRFAASPHLAAQLENRRTVPCKIKKAYKYLADRFDLVIAEGVGGALVPYDKKNLVIDIARELRLPILLVVQNKLGAINHTLLTLEALKKRKFKVLGVIFNNAKGQDPRILKDNPEIVKKFCHETIFGILEWQSSKNILQRKFAFIGKKIERALHES